ncbi:MAG: hypothetical protein ACLTBV_14585 [Enterocloster bolteae]
MRSSIVVLSALLGRMGEGSSYYPGGCLIGARPIDLHLMALRALGADIRERDGTIEASCRKNGGLKGTEIHLSYPSVGATEQAILASVLADGGDHHPPGCQGTGNQPDVPLPLITWGLLSAAWEPTI